MNTAKIIRYRFEYTTLPHGAANCLHWALACWRTALSDNVIFTASSLADWQFEFSQHPNWPEKTARCTHTSDTVKTISFDPREKWAVTSWQRFWGSGPCLRTYALHEIGHALGVHHDTNVNSIMHPSPKNPRIDKATVGRVRLG